MRPIFENIFSPHEMEIQDGEMILSRGYDYGTLIGRRIFNFGLHWTFRGFEAPHSMQFLLLDELRWEVCVIIMRILHSGSPATAANGKLITILMCLKISILWGQNRNSHRRTALNPSQIPEYRQEGTRFAFETEPRGQVRTFPTARTLSSPGQSYISHLFHSLSTQRGRELQGSEGGHKGMGNQALCPICCLYTPSCWRKQVERERERERPLLCLL